jgi:putative methionine-R-sulfoxide reductase with GAF domain
MAVMVTSRRFPLEGDERLRMRRAVPDSSLITVEMSPAGFGLLYNISENGFGVYPMTTLAPAQVVQVSFHLPDSAEAIECAGEVRWATDSHAGVEFQYLDEKSSAALSSWMSTLTSPPAIIPTREQRREFPVRDEQLKAIEMYILEDKLNLDHALFFLVTRLVDIAEASGVAVALAERGEIVCRASAGLAPNVGVRIIAGSGLSGECLRTGKTIYCEDTQSDARVNPDASRSLKLRSSLMVPFFHDGKIAGVLSVFSPRRDAFKEDLRWLVEQLAGLLGHLTNGGFRPR